MWELLCSAYECLYADCIIPNADKQAKEKGKAKANSKKSKENVRLPSTTRGNKLSFLHLIRKKK